MKITDEMIEEIATKACREASPDGVFVFQASPFACAKIAARLALDAAFAALSLDEAEAVGYRWKHPNESTWKYGLGHPGWDETSPYVVQPLFTHPSTGTRDEVLKLREASQSKNPKRLIRALKLISDATCIVYDEDLNTMVEVAMDEEQMANIARGALLEWNDALSAPKPAARSSLASTGGDE